MFPQPHQALPLPERPNLEHYRKIAKSLLKSAKSGDLAALSDFARRQLADRPTLTKAQLVIARTHGFQSWPKFARHLAALARNSPVSRFEAAVDAIVNGDADTLRELLRADPKLVRARSTREHAATLLIYVAANGVEDYRQKTPPNIVEIAELLLNAGADVNATANVYGGECATLELVATSVHPERAGVQEALLQKLLDRGASIEKPTLITACLANGHPKAAQFLAAHGATIDLPGAAGLGRLDTVRALIDSADAAQRRDAFCWACEYGRNTAVEILLEKGADLGAHRADGQTALHWAVIGGHPDTVKLLLRHNPPLEAENRYGGTVLGQTLWSAAHAKHAQADAFIEILDALLAAGAKLPERHVPVNPRIDAWLAARGSLAEPAWYWYGEKPSRTSAG
jgi:ankyrin repeat protein